ncbi:MAG: family 16 glycoside hydrolase, partial [Acidobacteriota bacterium]
MRRASLTLLFSLALVWAPAVPGQQEIRFAGAGWRLQGEGKLSQLDGREALLLRNGSAQLLDTEFANGTIEFDVRTTGHRSFVGLGFRVQGPHREDFYLRPHNSGRFDAMQYTPVYHGLGAWQLYPEHNAGTEIPPDQWLHVRLVVAGPRLEVFFDGQSGPALVVPQLMRGNTRGGLGLWASFPGGEPQDLFPTAFANVSVRPDSAAYEHPPIASPTTDSGLVRHWAVSPAFPDPEDPEVVPAIDPLGPWQRLAADAEGRVNLASVATPLGDGRRGTVLARVVLRSDARRTVRLGFGFSDRATVFLRGKPVFRGDNTYRSRSKRYLGVMRVDND